MIINFNDFLNENNINKICKKIIFNGYTILVGRNAESNDILTFNIADDNDIFLHISGYPSSHVIIKNNENDVIPKEVIEFAAKLSINNKIPKGDVKIIWTKRKNVTKDDKHNVGQVSVNYDKSKFIIVNID